MLVETSIIFELIPINWSRCLKPGKQNLSNILQGLCCINRGLVGLGFLRVDLTETDGFVIFFVPSCDQRIYFVLQNEQFRCTKKFVKIETLVNEVDGVPKNAGPIRAVRGLKPTNLYFVEVF